MTLVDKIKILDSKTKANEPKYKLDREEAKVSILSTEKFDKMSI